MRGLRGSWAFTLAQKWEGDAGGRGGGSGSPARTCCYLLTLAGDVHAKVDPVDLVHVQRARSHEHGCVPRSPATPPGVRSGVLPSQIGFRFNNPSPQLPSVGQFPNQNLKEGRARLPDVSGLRGPPPCAAPTVRAEGLRGARTTPFDLAGERLGLGGKGGRVRGALAAAPTSLHPRADGLTCPSRALARRTQGWSK